MSAGKFHRTPDEELDYLLAQMDVENKSNARDVAEVRQTSSLWMVEGSSLDGTLSLMNMPSGSGFGVSQATHGVGHTAGYDSNVRFLGANGGVVTNAAHLTSNVCVIPEVGRAKERASMEH